MHRACDAFTIISGDLELETRIRTDPHISTTISLGHLCKLHLEIVCQAWLPSFGVNVDDASSRFFIGKREVELSVETARSSEGWIHRVGPVRSSNHDNLTCELQQVISTLYLRDL